MIFLAPLLALGRVGLWVFRAMASPAGFLATISLSAGIWIFFEDVIYFLLKFLTLFYIKFLTVFVSIAWPLAQDLFIELNLSAHIQTSWGLIPEEYRLIMGYFQVPEIISILMTFGLVRLLMRVARI